MALTSSDRQQIQQSINAYCHIVDYGEPEAVRALFTDDMVFAVPASGQVFKGIDAFIKVLAARRERRDGMRHLIVNTVISEHESAVTSSAYLQLIRVERGVPQLAKLARYVDEWTCHSGQWRIHSRRMEE